MKLKAPIQPFGGGESLMFFEGEKMYKHSHKDTGFTFVEFLIVVVMFGLLGWITFITVRVRDDSKAKNAVTTSSIVEWALGIAPVPSNTPTMSEDTWAHVIQAAAAGNLDFNVLHGGRDNLGRETSTGDGYSVSFTRIAIDLDYQPRACRPAMDLSTSDIGAVAMVTYLIENDLSIDPPQQPVLVQVQGNPHPVPHAFTVHLTATSDEEAGQQMIGLFNEIAAHPLGCAP